jgi:nitrogen fixation protein NifU and related proteins
MSDALYQGTILDLAKVGKALPRLENASVSARVDNPICGDRVTVDLMLDGDVITTVGAKVQGCALCQASVAIIAEHAVGKPSGQIPAVADAVSGYLAGGGPDDALPWPSLSAFAPVRAAKSRWECVMLPFRAAVKALSGAG